MEKYLGNLFRGTEQQPIIGFISIGNTDLEYTAPKKLGEHYLRSIQNNKNADRNMFDHTDLLT